MTVLPNAIKASYFVGGDKMEREKHYSLLRMLVPPHMGDQSPGEGEGEKRERKGVDKMEREREGEKEGQRGREGGGGGEGGREGGRE